MNTAVNEQETLLSLENVSIDYKVDDGYLSAVHDISFSMRKGEFFALVGESGCGKSTIAHSIMRLSLDHNERISGSIHFGGQDLAKISDQEMEKIRGKQIGMIFQNPLDSLNPVYRAGTQVEEALVHSGMSREEAKKRTVELFADVQIPDPERRVKSFPHELSGGMRQRVGIAMALACEPDILIADEPTTALDVTIQAQILELMQDLQKKLGMAIIMITHDLGVIAQLCDEVVVMYAGSICEQGTADEIFYNPKHEYTKGLLRSIPTDQTNGQKLVPITGTPIDLLNMPAGCPFAPRCDNAMKICLRERADRIRINDDHMATCWMNVKDASCEQTEQEEADHE